MAHERFVIDTNVFLSGLLFATTTPARAVERAIRAIPKYQVLASRETLRELTGMLLSPKFDRSSRAPGAWHCSTGLRPISSWWSSCSARVPAAIRRTLRSSKSP